MDCMMKWLTTVALGCFLVSPVSADDWPQWQGPNRTGMSQEKGLMKQWPEGGPALAWRIADLGGGDSAPAVANGRIIGMSNRGGDQVVWALSEKDGKELWVSKIGSAVEQRMPQSKEGPGGTPTVDGDHLYVVGMGGTVACLKVDDGEVLWKRSMTEDFGGIVPTWSYRESPLVDGDQVVVTPGASDVTMVALNKKTGETLWTTKIPKEEPKPEDNGDQNSNQGRGGRGRFRGPASEAAYSSAIAIDVDGDRQYVQLAGTALIGVSADKGEFLWKYEAPANRMRINCSTPVYQDGLIFAASAYGNGGGAIELKKTAAGQWEANEVYFTNKMQNHHGGMIVYDGCLYGANGGNEGGFMACLDFKTGEVLWRDRDAPKGSIAFADERLYLRSEDGTIVLIEPNKEAFVERGRFQQPDRTNSPAWAHPVIANGKLYIRDQDHLFCYDIQAQ
jgi:outer membrane protein assembly factor BamB